MSHNNNSLAEALDISTTVYFPEFFQFGELLYCNKSETVNCTPIVTNDTNCPTVSIYVSSTSTFGKVLEPETHPSWQGSNGKNELPSKYRTSMGAPVIGNNTSSKQ